MTITNTITKLTAVAFTFASLALGGCAMESSTESFPQENVASTATSAEELIVNEYPVAQIGTDEATITYRAIELPAELSDAHDSVLEQLHVELDIEVPVNELRSAAASDYMLVVDLDGYQAETPELKDCVMETATSEVSGFCYGETTAGVVVKLDRDQLTSAGFTLEAHTDIPMDIEKNVEVPVARF